MKALVIVLELVVAEVSKLGLGFFKLAISEIDDFRALSFKSQFVLAVGQNNDPVANCLGLAPPSLGSILNRSWERHFWKDVSPTGGLKSGNC